MKLFSQLVTILVFCTSVLKAQEIVTYNNHKVEKGRIVYKIKPELKSSIVNPNKPELNDQYIFDKILESIHATEPKQLYPESYMPDSCVNCVDISLIYEFFYSDEQDIASVLASIRGLSFVEYAEPTYIEELLYVPDDTETPSQWHMNTCRVYQAWDIEEGDTNVVIGITDAGFDISHTDLIDKIKYNYLDPINNFDDDYDGYIDNFGGWDFGSSDNNPDKGVSDHGTWVAGLAIAQVNNAFSIAGTGNKCMFLPVKIATDAGVLNRGYEGIIYAANQGCDIINCSWGSEGSYSKYALDIVNYATFNTNSLIIAAAGNSGNMGIYYPASYTNAFSVAGSVIGDQKWSQDNSSSSGASNYGYYVDIVAPAADYKSTAENDGTIRMYGGTSFATPIVSGIAALVKSKYPDLTALELGERLRATADDVYGVTYNAPYIDLLGSGRVNALEALTDLTTPSVRATTYSVANRNGSYKFFPGDTLELTITFKNYLATATNIFVAVSCENSFLAPLSATILFPTFNHNQEITTTIPFTFEIVETMPADVNTLFKVNYSGASYKGYEYLPIEFNPSYFDFEIGNWKTTATANSTITVLNPTNKKEYGAVYKNYPNMIYEGGLMISKPNEVPAAYVKRNKDFDIESFPKLLVADSVDILVESSFTNDNMGLHIHQYMYAWDDIDALIHEYRITQNSDSVYHNLSVGPYIDWIIVSQDYNKTGYVDSLQLGYIYSIDPLGFYAGIMPLHYHKTQFYAVDDIQLLDTVYAGNGLNDYEIRYALTHEKHFAGTFTNFGSLVSSATGSYISELHPDSVAIVRYAIIAADNYPDLIRTASHLKNNYVTDTSAKIPNGLELNDFNRMQAYIVNNQLLVEYIPQNFDASISVLSVVGNEVLSRQISVSNQNGIEKIDVTSLSAGVYIVQLTSGGMQYLQKVIVSR